MRLIREAQADFIVYATRGTPPGHGRPKGKDKSKKGKKAAWWPHGGLGGDLGTPEDKGKTSVSSGPKTLN